MENNQGNSKINSKPKSKPKSKTPDSLTTRLQNNKSKIIVRLRLDVHVEDHVGHCISEEEDRLCLDMHDHQVTLLHSLSYSQEMLKISNVLNMALSCQFPEEIIMIIIQYSFEIDVGDKQIIEGSRGCTKIGGTGWCLANTYSNIESLTIEESKMTYHSNDDDSSAHKNIILPFELWFKPIQVIGCIKQTNTSFSSPIVG
jgi:hypothetical protein